MNFLLCTSQRSNGESDINWAGKTGHPAGRKGLEKSQKQEGSGNIEQIGLFTVKGMKGS